MCSEVCSPRISFSYGIGQSEGDSFMQIQQQLEYESDSSCIPDSNPDFEFISACFEYEISSADELFSNGMILPIQVHPKTAQNDLPKPSHRNNHSKSQSLPPLPSIIESNSKKEVIKETAISNSTLESPEEKSSNSKSFWGFKRSTSLNSEGAQKRSLICSFPLLPRSNSTGSVSKKTSQKQSSIALVKSSSMSSSLPPSSSPSSYSQKPPLKKGYGHGSFYHGNGVRVSPVLNVPTHHLLGLGSFLRNGKDKKTRR